MKEIVVKKNMGNMTRKELCAELFNLYKKDGLDPDGKKITLTEAEFNKRYLKGTKYRNKEQLSKMLGKRLENKTNRKTR